MMYQKYTGTIQRRKMPLVKSVPAAQLIAAQGDEFDFEGYYHIASVTYDDPSGEIILHGQRVHDIKRRPPHADPHKHDDLDAVEMLVKAPIELFRDRLNDELIGYDNLKIDTIFKGRQQDALATLKDAGKQSPGSKIGDGTFTSHETRLLCQAAFAPTLLTMLENLKIMVQQRMFSDEALKTLGGDPATLRWRLGMCITIEEEICQKVRTLLKSLYQHCDYESLGGEKLRMGLDEFLSAGERKLHTLWSDMRSEVVTVVHNKGESCIEPLKERSAAVRVA